MESTAISRSLQRSVDQQMMIHRTQRLLTDAVQKAFDSIGVDAQKNPMFVEGMVSAGLASDLRFFEHDIKPLLGSPNVHIALKTNKMPIHIRNAQAMLAENNGALFAGLLDGRLPDFAAAEPSDFVKLAAPGEYFGGSKPSALSTLLIETLFILTGHTIAHIGNACGVLQKMNFPNDVRFPLGIESPWLMRGAEGGCDIVGVVHSGYVFGGCREYPITPLFDKTVFKTLLSPLGAEDCSTFVYANLNKHLTAPYALPFAFTTSDMQYGYRRHLQKDPDFQFKAKLKCGDLPESIAAFFNDLFVATEHPSRGDIAIINTYTCSSDDSFEDVIYGGRPGGGHTGFVWDSSTIVAASRDLEGANSMEGIGLQRLAPSSVSPGNIKHVTFLKIVSEMNDTIPDPPSFSERMEFFEKRFSIDTTDFSVRVKEEVCKP